MKQKNKTQKKVEMKIQADKLVYASDSTSERILEIVLTSPKKDESKERAPLNLSFVLDRSGSMQGEKLQFVKKAAAHVIELLSEKDRVSVVTYDNEVMVLSPTTYMSDENKIKAKSMIQSIRPGGSTFLSGGWLKGCEQVAIGATEQTINRTLLLTDGLANVGTSDIDELVTHSRELFSRGVSTSCFGVGLGYNEHMLEAMANSGGGNFHFLETLNAIPLVFEREFEELTSVTMRNTEIKIDLPEPIKVKIFSGWQFERNADHLLLSIGTLYSGQTMSIYIELQIDNSINLSDLTIPVHVRGVGEGESIYEENMQISLKAVTTIEEEKTAYDPHLMERFSEIDLAENANEALKMDRRGDKVAASQLLHASVQKRQNYMSASSKDKYGFISRELNAGIGEDGYKKLHREVYETRRGREKIRDYPITLEKGYPLIRIDGINVLLDTGLIKSEGNRTEWYFLNTVFHLLPSPKRGKLEYLNSILDKRVDILLGTDILHDYFVNVDLSNQRISFTDRPLLISRNRTKIVSTWRLQITPFTITGTDFRVFLDSSSRLSYIRKSIADKLSPIGQDMGFYVNEGEFPTSIYQVPVNIGGIEFDLRCGVLPPQVEKELFEDRRDGIIGSELLEKFVIAYNFPDKLFEFRENQILSK
ncbi:MAG: VWA domain-containing protein [Anaerolineaceae bacterium]|nr:VWA domain-containing protein [Anaerolineaceae bacterium]